MKLCTECFQLHRTDLPCPDDREHSRPPFDFTNADLGSCPCAGTGWLGCEWLDKREPRCTCGAGDPLDINLLHDVACDSVPCPFCPSEATP